ncbi:ABC-three component system protein [Aeromonas veronii]|uniref:ABC-three component system protein n=1 Tax=Aeromonas veronii TaxID=654 RepID=UPI0035B8520C
MIDDADLIEIKPPAQSCAALVEHVQTGIPVTKASRLMIFSPDEWEQFVEEWASYLLSLYKKVRRFGGSGDLGIDIAGFQDDNGFMGAWDNYQCKRYQSALTPTNVYVEIGKIIYYSFQRRYKPPKKYYFVASNGIGTTLEQLLCNHVQLKLKTKENWAAYCETQITKTCKVSLTGSLLAYFDDFDFSIFTSKSAIELINEHAKTNYHTVRFGGGLPPRPISAIPPQNLSDIEIKYVAEILNAYSEHIDEIIINASDLDSECTKRKKLKKDLLRQRERFYNAEALRNFARDNVPEGTFNSLQHEVFHGVIDTCLNDYDDGYKRMLATLEKASNLVMTSNPLIQAIKVQDKQGICHQLVNADKLKWVDDDE